MGSLPFQFQNYSRGCEKSNNPWAPQGARSFFALSPAFSPWRSQASRVQFQKTNLCFEDRLRFKGRWQRQLGEAPAQPWLLPSPGDMPITPAGASRRLLSASSGTTSSHTWWPHLLGLLLQRPARCEEDRPGVPKCAPGRMCLMFFSC